jgi:hypothetical protein
MGNRLPLVPAKAGTQRIYRDVGSVGLVSRFRGNERKDYAALRLAKKSPTRSSARRMFSVELA